MSYSHGGDIYGENNIKLDFSVNTNCLGMPETIRNAIISSIATWEQYPDPLCRKISDAAEMFYRADGTPFPKEWLVFGNGASDILYSLIMAIHPDKAFLLAPGFSEYEKALKMSDCEIKRFYLEEKNGFYAENIIEKIIENPDFMSCDKNYTQIMILGNPNNPTGHAISAALMEKLAAVCQKNHTWLIIDECFQWFLNDRKNSSFVSKLTDKFTNVIIINALTKICSMAGLRLGYGIIPNEKLRHNLENFRQPWSVSAPAENGGAAAFLEIANHIGENFLKKTTDHLKIERPWLKEQLEKLGFIVYPSETNFLLFRSPDEDTTDYKEVCLKNEILIRSCNNFVGLDNHYYRVAVKKRLENEILITTLKRFRNKGESLHWQK